MSPSSLEEGQMPMRKEKGFTLVELAVLLFILGIIAASLFPLYITIQKNNRIKETEEKLLRIKDALISYYKENLSLPSPERGICGDYSVPVSTLGMEEELLFDDISGACILYVSTNDGSPFSLIYVDGNSIGKTAAVLISRGFNKSFDDENKNISNGRFTQRGNSKDFDDIVVVLTERELSSATSWLRELYEDIGTLNAAALLIASDDDDFDGFIDEDPSDAPCKKNYDPPGNCDGLTDYKLIDKNGIEAIIKAGVVSNSQVLIDPWGSFYEWSKRKKTFYSIGPNKKDEKGKGDDILP